MGWAGYVARTEGRRGAHRVLVGRLREIDHLEELGVDGRVILEMKHQEVEWRGMDWTAVAEDKDRWRGPWGSVKCGEFLD
jgi:hypothetical protein